MADNEFMPMPAGRTRAVSELPAPVEVEGVLPSEEDAYYEQVGVPLLLELLSNASGRGGQVGEVQPGGASPLRELPTYTPSRSEQGMPTPRSRFEAASHLMKAKKARVSNPGVPNLPATQGIVNQRMSMPQQQQMSMPQQQQSMRQQPMQQQRPPAGRTRAPQPAKPEIYKNLRQGQQSEAPRPTQAFSME